MVCAIDWGVTKEHFIILALTRKFFQPWGIVILGRFYECVFECVRGEFVSLMECNGGRTDRDLYAIRPTSHRNTINSPLPPRRRSNLLTVTTFNTTLYSMTPWSLPSPQPRGKETIGNPLGHWRWRWFTECSYSRELSMSTPNCTLVCA